MDRLPTAMRSRSPFPSCRQWFLSSLRGGGPTFALWGTVAPNLGYSNIAREIWMDLELDPHIPSFSTVMACATGMAAVFEAAAQLGNGGALALCGGVESMSRVQVGLSQELSDWLRRLTQAKSNTDRLKMLADLSLGVVKLHIPSRTRSPTRVTGARSRPPSGASSRTSSST